MSIIDFVGKDIMYEVTPCTLYMDCVNLSHSNKKRA